MTQLPTHPLTDRKDLETLISHQTQNPCLQGNGLGAESVLAFLLQLYAYVSAKFGTDIGASYESTSVSAGGTGLLKDHLMTSGRYQVVIYITDFRARPNALRLRQKPEIYNGASIGSWIILWPGAERDTYFKTGRVVSAVDMQMSKNLTVTHGLDEATAISTMRAVIFDDGYHCVPSILPTTRRPIRLIPP